MTSTLFTNSPRHPKARGNRTALSRLLIGSFGSIASAVFAWKMGSGPLGTPPVRTISWQTIQHWYGLRTPLEAGLGLVRIATFSIAIVSALLFLLSFLSALFILRPEKWAQRVGRQLAVVLPRPFRRWRDLAAGVGLSAAMVIAPMSASFASALKPTSAPSSQVQPTGPIGPAPAVTERVDLVATRRPTMAANARAPLATETADSVSPAPVIGDPTSGQQWPDIRDVIANSTNVATPRASAQATAQATAPTPTQAPTPASRTNAARTTATASTAAESPSLATPGPKTAVAHAPVAVKREHQVRPGESFWSIAEAEVMRTTGNPTEQQVNAYCSELIRANRSKLPDPSNPDVILVGTVIEVGVGVVLNGKEAKSDGEAL
jgi:hypothetical protein